MNFTDIPDWLNIIINSILNSTLTLLIARLSFKYEMKKNKEINHREDILHCQQTFSNLISSLDCYIDFPNGHYKEKLRIAISNMLSIAIPELQPILQKINIENKSELLNIKSELISQYSISQMSKYNTRKRKK